MEEKCLYESYYDYEGVVILGERKCITVLDAVLHYKGANEFHLTYQIYSKIQILKNR